SFLFGLAPDGVYLAASVASRAVGSYPTLSPLPRARGAGCFLRHGSLGFPPPGVTRHRVPWGRDFPRTRPFDTCARGRPAGWQNADKGGRTAIATPKRCYPPYSRPMTEVIWPSCASLLRNRRKKSD